MSTSQLFCLALIHALILSTVSPLPAPKKVEDMKKVAMTEEEFKKVQQLHYGWYVQAVSALLGAMGKELYMKMDRNNRRAFVACLDNIEKEHDLQSGAKCLVKAFDNQLVKSYPYALHRSYYDFVDESIKRPAVVKKKTLVRKIIKNLVRANAATLLKLNFSNKQQKMLRRSFMKKVKAGSIDGAKRIDHSYPPLKPINMRSMPPLVAPRKSPAKVLTELFGSIWRAANNRTIKQRNNLHSSLNKLEQFQMRARKAPPLKHRMLDMVIGDNNPLQRKRSLTDRSVFSPDLFPLYKDDTDSSILPIPEVLKKSGLSSSDQSSIMELIMDVAGVNDVVEKSLKVVSNMERFGLDEDLLSVTTAIDNIFLALERSLEADQRRELAMRKYSFLTKDQLLQLYGENGIMNITVVNIPFNIDEFDSMSRIEKEEALRNTVRLIAKDPKALPKSRRHKRAIVFFRHTTLAPFIFAPTITTVNVLGPLTLSPNIFSPSVLSPLLLSPPTLSPQVGDPLILSPYVLGPNTLSAAVMNAYVLSPYVLSPNVINPYVLSPLVLSPFVLCPDVLSPTVLSGSILSPSVLSPALYTEAVLAADVLSPSFLS